MYSEGEIESAVASGKLSADAAAALRAHVAGLRDAPLADEEQFRLVTSFNDIFVVIAGVLVLVGAGWIGAALQPALSGLAVAIAAWGLSEYFTRRKRMALPSIVFFLAFVGGCYAFAVLTLLPDRSWFQGGDGREFLLGQVAGAAIVVAASAAHWRRFMVPITIAVGVAAIARLIFTIVTWAAWPNVGQWTLALVFAGGIAIFLYAMRWDMQDRARQTRKSDVAFWLHLIASPMIVHPLFVLVGINVGLERQGGALIAVLALGIYAGLAVVAVVVDRRAILVSALAYVLVAAIYLVNLLGSGGVGFAVAILLIGGSLLMLSAFWQAIRRRVLPMLPARLQQIMPVAA